MKFVTWLALIIACIAMLLVLASYPGLSNRVENLETRVAEHDSVLESLKETWVDMLASIGEPSCENPEWELPELPPLPESKP